MKQIISGLKYDTETAALLSRPAPAPILDADREQRRPIDEGLIRSFA